ncbi:phosphoribosylamine--glycine ligase [Gemmatimonas sp.]|jgi:phosphoribosylamine--glycine ligase|uniref:phosphoribosylamine--glycine ligase n=2 Tax=Gemmatimonas sp. TaxID=1962908 RepID=UPI0022C00B4D|nr:phosphoribosylamine--glycine ligase [Gemmatimonas sp.]MCA2983633.1 phosphoribosylamine--glycine ligase [Gemmatimonas sp.]MCA2987740.1 phosphoribosylamine--glycine ligase [Gemmatimonas sp.]MCA2990192.1 phosphoribosylamine--glycine ligase [Gemmatimonas sp.]MCA2995348.1 phosphoribosylamine--glycine ligase [Gemmatimonas sp.]MCE2955247.1 phosphoribosylamine--glycine ligase [Gemmatimonas sp.]
MKILLLGSGGREHALADALSRENTPVDLIAAPGNPGIAELARLVSINANDPREVAALAEAEQVGLVVVGPEAPLAAGVVDHLQQRGIPAFGPTMGAATVETSKADTKALMMAAGIPTAHAETHRLAREAKEAVRTRFGAPVVIKASGLAAGKGVIVCQTEAEAFDAIDRILDDRVFGEAGAECLVEAFMTGEELSLFAIADGHDVLPMIGAQDHKRLLDGDEGPNTGGMGAYTPVSFSTPSLVDDVTERIFLPTLHALRTRGTPFTGLLYAGLMLTPEGPKVVEFNCRFGDPETQAILPMLTSSLLDPLLAVSRGARIGNMAPFQWRRGASVTTVVASGGYPDAPVTGFPVHLPSFSDSVRVFHAGTKRGDNGDLLTSGGRVFAVTALADSFAAAQRASRDAASRIEFEGAVYRRDIGWREASRVG